MGNEIEQRIRERAFEIYEWRIENDVEGCALGDWLEAKEEVMRKEYKDEFR